MSLLDSGFGLAFSFEVKEIQDLRALRQELRADEQHLQMVAAAQRQMGGTSAEVAAKLRGVQSELRQVNGALAMSMEDYQTTSIAMYSASRAAAVAGAAFTGLGMAGVGLMKAAVTEAMAFEQALNSLQIRAGIGGEQLQLLGDAFKDLANELPGTAIDMAKAGEQFAKSGVTEVAALKNLTREALVLASAEGLQVETAANTLMQTTNVFRDSLNNLVGPDRAAQVERFNSSLITMSDATVASADELMNISRRAGAAAAMVGLTADQMLALAASVREFGVTPEVAGTAMSNMLTKLASDLPKVADALGIDEQALAAASGMDRLNMVLRQLALKQAAGDLSGFKEGVKALVGSGARGFMTVAALSKAFQEGKLHDLAQRSADAFDQGGLASRRMEDRLKTLSARIEQLASIWSSIKISVGETFSPVIGVLVNVLRSVAGAFNALPGPVKHLVGWVVLFGTVTALAIGGALLALAGFGFALQGVQGISIALGLQTQTVGATISTVWAIAKAKALGYAGSLRQIAVVNNLVVASQKALNLATAAQAGVLAGAKRGWYLAGVAAKDGFAKKAEDIHLLLSGGFGRLGGVVGRVGQMFPWLIKMVTKPVTAVRYLFGLLGWTGWGAILLGTIMLVIAGWDHFTAAAKRFGDTMSLMWRVITGQEMTVTDLNLLDRLGLVPLAVNLGLLKDHWDAFWGGFSAGASEGGGFLDDMGIAEWGAVVDGVIGMLREAFDPLIALFTDLTSGIKEVTGGTGGFGETLGMLWQWAQPILQFMVVMFGVVLKGAIGLAVAAMVGVIRGFQMLASWGKLIWTVLAAPFRALWVVLQTVWAALKAVFTGDWGSVWDTLASGFGSILGDLWDAFAGFIVSAMKFVGDTVVAVINSFSSELAAWIAGLFAQLLVKAVAVKDKIKGFFGMGGEKEAPKEAAKKAATGTGLRLAGATGPGAGQQYIYQYQRPVELTASGAFRAPLGAAGGPGTAAAPIAQTVTVMSNTVLKVNDQEIAQAAGTGKAKTKQSRGVAEGVALRGVGGGGA